MSNSTDGSEDNVRRRPRSVSATDTEWQRVRKRAASAGLSVSQYLLERSLEPVIENLQEVGPQPPWLRRAARDCIALGLLQEWRFAEQGREDEWQKVTADAERLIAAQEPMQ